MKKRIKLFRATGWTCIIFGLLFALYFVSLPVLGVEVRALALIKFIMFPVATCIYGYLLIRRSRKMKEEEENNSVESPSRNEG